MSQSPEAIKPCRCGCGPSDDHHAVQVQTYRSFDIDGPNDCYVLCEMCGVEGPYARTRQIAVGLWNRRKA